MRAMALRILLSLAMLIPAAPVKPETGECPFTSIDECRAWLEECCGAGDRVAEFCRIAERTCDDAGCGDRGAVSPGGCCSDDEPDASQFDCGGGRCTEEAEESREESPESCCTSTSCSDESTCDDEDSSSSCAVAHADNSVEMTGDACPAHSSSKCALQCLLCCCCPLRPVRLPQPQPTPVTQRTSLEKEKVLEDAPPVAVQPNVQRPHRALRDFPPIPMTCSTRQAVLCVWLN